MQPSYANAKEIPALEHNNNQDIETFAERVLRIRWESHAHKPNIYPTKLDALDSMKPSKNGFGVSLTQNPLNSQ